MEAIIFLNRNKFVVREIDLKSNTEIVAFHWGPGENALEYHLPNGVEVRWVKNYSDSNVFFSYKDVKLFEKIKYANTTAVAGLMNDYLQFSEKQLEDKLFQALQLKDNSLSQNSSKPEGLTNLNVKIEHAINPGWNKQFSEIIKVFLIHTFTLQGMNYVNCEHKRRRLYPILGYSALLLVVFSLFLDNIVFLLIALLGFLYAYLGGLIDSFLELSHRRYVPNPINYFIRK